MLPRRLCGFEYMFVPKIWYSLRNKIGNWRTQTPTADLKHANQCVSLLKTSFFLAPVLILSKNLLLHDPFCFAGFIFPFSPATAVKK